MPTMSPARLLLAIVVSACGSNTTTTSDGGGVCGDYPRCVAAVMETCAPSGSCTIADSSEGRVTTFSNGVVRVTSTDTSNPAMPRDLVRVTRSDGTTTCYTVEASAPAGGNPIATFRDASGATLATGVARAAERTIDVTCTGGATTSVVNFGDCFGKAYVCAAAPTP
jgi:hypothetical protein